MIKAKDITFEYIRRDTEGNVTEIETALDKVSLHIKQGQFVAILGHNGSGKSTLAKHINAIYSPEEGSMYIDGKDSKDLSKLYEIRKSAGMVFQNPDNQIISTVVEEDVAFGPENIGVSTENIRSRVKEALNSVKMWDKRKQSPNKLSGGQKQRVAIAGVMAMEPKIIVLDEPTAMLDPGGRKDVLDTVKRLNKEKNITVVLITHYMEETVDTDQIIVMDHGQVKLTGTPTEVFANVEELEGYGLEVPFATRIAYKLRKKGIPISNVILTLDELVRELESVIPAESRLKSGELSEFRKNFIDNRYYEEPSVSEISDKGGIILDNVSYTYNEGTVFEKKAVENVSLTITPGELIGVLGHTGSGKSTMIQLFNGLLKATAGRVYFNGQDVAEEGFSMKNLRSKVGMTFQYPENQLFAYTVLEDVEFGPKNLGWENLKVEQESFNAIKLVGLPDDCYDLSPFELSGGQKRRVAIAGVLAMNPDYIVLDEPAAGLDPKGRNEILAQIKRIAKERNMAVILVSHSMDDVAEFADRLIVMDDGKLVFNDYTDKVFLNADTLENIGLAIPQSLELMRRLSNEGYKVNPYVIKEEEAISEILGLMVG